jgi:hypothetical protein
MVREASAMGRTAEDGPLEELRHHWGSAYRIGVRAGRWTAQRRDGKGRPLADREPGRLREKIAADYLASPVPRDLP